MNGIDGESPQPAPRVEPERRESPIPSAPDPRVPASRDGAHTPARPRSTGKAAVHEPRQARSQETLERFVDATRELLAERSFEEITVSDIVRRADRTVGSFYARFDDKYAVLHELTCRTYERIRHVMRAYCDPSRWEGVSLEEFVSESVRLNVQGYRRSATLVRASLKAVTVDERFRRSRAEALRFCAEQQKAFIMTRTAEMDSTDPARASDQMFELVAATLVHELLFGSFTHTSPTSDIEMVRDLTEKCLSVLKVIPSDRT